MVKHRHNRDRSNESDNQEQSNMDQHVVEQQAVETKSTTEIVEQVQQTETAPTEVPVEQVVEQPAPVEQVETIQLTAEPVQNEVDPFWVKDEGNLAVKTETSQDQMATDFINKARTFQTQSGRVRWLTSQGLNRGQIVKAYPGLYGRTILYQHVRNILVTPVKNVG